MARWSRTLLALAAAALLAAPSAFAQGGGASSTGSISGEVKDAQGGVLPGVTVTATSPAQIGALTAVTNEAGIYRFPSVPPGDYALTLRTGRLRPRQARRHPHHAGLQRPGQRGRSAWRRSRRRSRSAASRRSSTRPPPASRPTTTRSSWPRCPTPATCGRCWRRRPSVTLNRVDVGGATMGTQTTYFAYGYSGQNRPLIEGINTTEGTSAAGFYLDYGSFEEVFIGAAGNSAEMPNPGRAHPVRRQERQQPAQRSASTTTSKTRASRAATWRPTRSVARTPRSAPTATAWPATRTSTSASAARCCATRSGRRFDYLEPAQLGGGAALGQLPRRHAVQHQAASTTPAS